MRQHQEEEYDPDLDYEPDPQGPEGPTVDPRQVQHYIDLLRTRQHLPMAILAGIIGLMVSAGAWLAMTAMFGLQVGWMAIVAGVVVGFMMRAFGHGIDLPFSIVAVILVAMTIAVGILLSGCALAAQVSKEVSFVDVMSTLKPMQVLEIMRSTFDGIDVLFDVTGLLAGFLIARRRVKARSIVAFVAAEQQQKQQQRQVA